MSVSLASGHTFITMQENNPTGFVGTPYICWPLKFFEVPSRVQQRQLVEVARYWHLESPFPCRFFPDLDLLLQHDSYSHLNISPRTTPQTHSVSFEKHSSDHRPKLIPLRRQHWAPREKGYLTVYSGSMVLKTEVIRFHSSGSNSCNKCVCFPALGGRLQATDFGNHPFHKVVLLFCL